MVRMRSRYLQRAIEETALLRNKMAFLSGPRQCGKTTLARGLISPTDEGRYYNWDEIEFRRLWIKSPSRLIPEEKGNHPLLVFDEIHKAKNWKTTLKGLYDRFGSEFRFIVTGSARLNTYRKGGDSLLGRYYHFRLHPFSVGEALERPPLGPDDALRSLLSLPAAPSGAQEAFQQLMRFGGFPEPFLAQSEKVARLWRKGRLEKIVREDLRDLSRLPELSKVEMLAALLPEKAGGMLSPQSLREDLEVAHDTVRRWLNYLQELYYHFELKPYSRSIPRALKKEGKLYLWDWSEVLAEGNRFENLVASHLLKACHFWSDTGEGSFELGFLRNKEKEEVDFLITRDRKPWLLVEAKLSDAGWHRPFDSFRKHLGTTLPCITIIAAPGIRKVLREGSGPTVAVSAASALSCLP